jgi:hypothetical protein
MKFVYLDTKYDELAISDEAYTLIEALATSNRVCKRCSTAYTEANPLVADNLCLGCFLKMNAHTHLTFVGKHSESIYGHSTYSYVDPKGYIHLSYTSSAKCEQSNYDTITYWGFPVPATVTRGDKEKILTSSYWHLYGNFRENQAIVIKYHEYYGDHLVVAFLVFKDGTILELNKRKGEIQKLFKRAREKLVSTKDSKGVYHLGEGWTTSMIEDGHLYPVIADLANADVQTPAKEQDG